ncbi:DNA repair protein MmcB-related protein [Paenibacillus anaericanus]|uniref:DNA repair protein MmcB-related protein n=2 Tax=Paenibacillus anaericanus TaxID=170367 RepID=A0A433YFY9_9BACL|nr:DNA repair protein MmcB-related protein [Paenibacillus anaericanus]
MFLTEVKTGRTYDNNELLKFDALAMKPSWANPCLTGYEVKVSRSDFMQDQKWPGYMAYCNKFSFVCPKGLIQKEELPEEVGLIWYYPDTGALRTIRPAKHRLVEIPSDIYQYMLMSRIDPDRHPFFGSRREMLEAYVEDRVNRKSLGKEVGSKLANELYEARKQLDENQWEYNNLKSESELMGTVRTVLAEYGIRIYKYNDWQSQIRQRMTTGVNPQMIKLLNEVTENAEKLKMMVEPKEDAI